MIRFALIAVASISVLGAVRALEPAEVFLIVNRNVPESAQVAEHYRLKRGVPKENVIVLDLPTADDMTRADYRTKVVAPLRAALKDRKDQIRVLLCIYGVPLRIQGEDPSAKENADIAKIDAELRPKREIATRLAAQIKELEPAAKTPGSDAAQNLSKLREEHRIAQNQVRALEQRRTMMGTSRSPSALDNELMLLWWERDQLKRFLTNPLHWQFSDAYRKSKPPMMMAARLDAPTAAIAKRMVDDAIEVEKSGLVGKVYVDARDQKFDFKKHSGYGYEGYDESMREMAGLLKTAGLDVVLDDKSGVFAPNSCPQCALYCGWYSHANFVDSFRFVKGAVAWHLASSEAISLRRKDSRLWCPNILLKGACATLGPVAEPYTIGFPKPAEFFGFLATGEYTLVECYARTLHLTSWMCTLIGDPLYNPFKNAKKLITESIQPSPKGARFIEVQPK